MDQDLLTEMNQLNQLYLARIDSLEQQLGLARVDAARLLRQVFEKSSSLEVLALVYRDYGYSPASTPASTPLGLPATSYGHPNEASRQPADASRQPSESSRQPSESSRHPGESSRQPSESSRQPSVVEAERLEQEEAEKARQAEEKARLHQEVLRQREAEAQRKEDERLAAEAAEKAAAEAKAAAMQAAHASELERQLSEIERDPDIRHLQQVLERELEPELREAAQQRLADLFKLLLDQGPGLRELESLATQLPPELPRHMRTRLMKQISAQWESLISEGLEQAGDIDALGQLTRNAILYWQICDLQNQPTTPPQRIYVRIVERWLQLILTVPDLREVDLPPLTFSFNEETQLILTDEELFAETEKIWESFVQKRIAFTGSMQALKDLYNSQDWGEFYAPARKRILSTWNELTTEALEDREGFDGIAQVVRMGGSDLAVAAWIDAAHSWEELTEIQTTVELTVKKRDLYDMLVEKFLGFADTEAKVRQAHSMLRSTTLNWMMGDRV